MIKKLFGLLLVLNVTGACTKSQEKIEDSVLSEWNGITLGKSTQENILNRWKECKVSHNEVWNSVKDMPGVLPKKDRGCEFRPKKGPFSNIAIFVENLTVKNVILNVRPKHAKAYLDAIFKKYGKVDSIKGQNCGVDYKPETKEANDYWWESKNFYMFTCDYTVLTKKDNFYNGLRVYFSKKATPAELDKIRKEISNRNEIREKQKREAQENLKMEVEKNI